MSLAPEHILFIGRNHRGADNAFGIRLLVDGQPPFSAETISSLSDRSSFADYIDRSATFERFMI